jgi:hypothetical protein
VQVDLNAEAQNIVLTGADITSIHQVRVIVEQMKHVEEAVVICKPPEGGEIQADFSFSIPFLIKLIYGNQCR